VIDHWQNLIDITGGTCNILEELRVRKAMVGGDDGDYNHDEEDNGS
jgi:hypothetical protein